jgi:hypothetical protein
MTPRFHLALFTSLITAVAPVFGPAIACGPPPAGPAYIDVFGGETPDLNAFYDGRAGLITEESPRAMLYMDWRLLHGLPVGRDAGAKLSLPCCDSPDPDVWDATAAWQQAHNTVAGVAQSTGSVTTDIPTGDYSSRPNCRADAFVNATATLKARIASYGATSPWVEAWVANQDVVFAACGGTKVTLPALDPAAPAWLKADRAYQAAAAELYAGDNTGAAMAFTAIGADAGSSWRPMAPYLTARALLRQALVAKTPAAYAAASRAIDALAAAPAGTYGQGDVRAMTHMILFREDPAKATATLQAALLAPTIAPVAAADFKDFYALNMKAAAPPEMLDWIMTIKAEVAGSPDWADEDDAAKQLAERTQALTQSLAHAQAMWSKTKDEAWLVAALTLVSPSDPAAAGLAAEAAKVQPGSQAYVTAVYNRIRLTMATAPQADTRAAIDQMLARHDLTTTERNLFTGERMQVAEDEAAFARLALRKVLCADDNDKSGCLRGNYNDEAEEGVLLDGAGKIGLGPDAMALIDRLPLTQRAALVSDADLPATLRMDIGLTTWTRAVLEQNNGVIDQLSGELAVLLPQLAPQWKQVVSTAPGPDKRFAEFYVMAQIPGLSTDLPLYTRPDGTIPNFQGNWQDWMILPAGATNGDYAPSCLLAYNPDGSCDPANFDGSDATLWAASDVVCQTYCGEGSFPMRRPDFMAATLSQWTAEQKRLATPYVNGKGMGASVWDEVLAWADAHPKDPRSPEALYWLIHVTRYGQSHNHLSHRAFDILHQRYPTSTWAKKTPYYFD